MELKQSVSFQPNRIEKWYRKKSFSGLQESTVKIYETHPLYNKKTFSSGKISFRIISLKKHYPIRCNFVGQPYIPFY